MGQGNTRWFKAKTQEGPRVQLPHVHVPVIVFSRDCEGTNTWAFTVCGSPVGGKYEHVTYENRVRVRRGATWLQAIIRIDGGSVPFTAVRFMDQKIAEYVGRKEKGMLGGRTHIKVEEGSGDEKQPERNRPKKGVVVCKSSR